jgi:hypothetical protein
MTPAEHQFEKTRAELLETRNKTKGENALASFLQTQGRLEKPRIRSRAFSGFL